MNANFFGEARFTNTAFTPNEPCRALSLLCLGNGLGELGDLGFTPYELGSLQKAFAHSDAFRWRRLVDGFTECHNDSLGRGVALGWVFFNEAPFDRLFPGVLLIVGAGLLIVWRESKAKAAVPHPRPSRKDR